MLGNNPYACDTWRHVTFKGTSYREVEFKGTPSAVALNSAIRDGRMVRINDHYKTNPLAAVVTQVPVNTYYEACQRNWKKEQEILEGVRDQVDPFAFAYIYAELEGMYLDNLFKYPFVVSDVCKKKIEECIPEGYWNVLDGYQVKNDKASLKSFAYIGWLIDYVEYRERREAYRAGKTYAGPQNMEEMYEKLAQTYDGDTRDAVLYLFLYKAIAEQQDFNVIGKLSKDYFKKYNRNKQFRKELSEMQK